MPQMLWTVSRCNHSIPFKESQVYLSCILPVACRALVFWLSEAPEMPPEGAVIWATRALSPAISAVSPDSAFQRHPEVRSGLG